jgi:hypothetical protein
MARELHEIVREALREISYRPDGSLRGEAAADEPNESFPGGPGLGLKPQITQVEVDKSLRFRPNAEYE